MALTQARAWYDQACAFEAGAHLALMKSKPCISIIFCMSLTLTGIHSIERCFIRLFMPRLLIINPNTTRAMTLGIDAAARAVKNADTMLTTINPAMGPVSIEGYYDEAFAVPGLLHEIASHLAADEPPDAIIIACFDDTGLEAARALSPAPVLGIGEAAFHCAACLGHKFSVVTTLSRSIAALENNLLKYGLAARCAKVRACEIPVLELDDPTSNARARIKTEILRAKAEDGAEAIVLGCAGMAAFARAMSAECGLPVLDGVSCAVKFAEALVALGLKTSKCGAYQVPRAKPYCGIFVPFAPQ